MSSFVENALFSVRHEDKTSTRITRVIEHTFKSSPHLRQLKALQSLLDKKQDTILYAPTNAGKCLIAQAYPLLFPGWILCIIPLI
jgi:superfamily II DNA helicase RecQ